MNLEFVEAGFVISRNLSADLEPDQNETDPQHCQK